jgi:adenine deaminase
MSIVQQLLAARIDQALGREPADLVVKNARLLNTATGRIEGPMDIAIAGDTVVGTHGVYEGLREIDARGRVVAPGFIDCHVHVESSMVLPAEFERGVLPCGTTTAICDPHELANVVGLEGISYFIEASRLLAMTLRVNLSSCVPATALETAGARLEADDLAPLMDDPAVVGLAELMNFPGVIHKDPGMLAKLERFFGRHIDGHSPLLRGSELNAYLSVGVSTEHECTSLEEAEEKLAKGMHILLREGSIAKNVTTLAPLLTETTWMRCGFCTDDRNPLEIREQGHIDHAMRLAIRAGAPVLAVYRAATLGAAMAFGLADRGIIAPGKRADLVILDDLDHVRVADVVVGGRAAGEALAEPRDHPTPPGYGSVRREAVTDADLALDGGRKVPVIGALSFSLLTDHLEAVPDEDPEIARLCVLERHGVNGNIGRGWVKGFGPIKGAIATSIGHDSHNLITVGDNTADMTVACNHLIAIQGGAVVVAGGKVVADLPLPVAGLMSDRDLAFVDARLVALRAEAEKIGCTLEEPLLQLAFLPLPVIPHLKLSDRGYVAAGPEGLRLLT